MPEIFFENIRGKIQKQWKICFVSAIIFGIFAHFYKITNWLPNWDSLVFRYDAQNMIGLGRWFLPVVTAPSTFYDIPWVCGLLSIIIHALSSVVICEIFDIKEKIAAAITGAIVVTLPTVTSVLMYNYVADGYAVAFLLSVSAAYMLTREKPKYLYAILFIVFSVGIYQAYITVVVMLLLLHMIMGVIKKEKTVVSTVKKGISYLLCGAGGLIIYYFTLELILKIRGQELLDYQGVNAAISLSGINIMESLYVCLKEFWKYFFDFSNGVSFFTLVNSAIFVICAIGYIILICREKVSFINVIMFLVLLALMPIGASILTFANSKVDYHNLMKMGYGVSYLFIVLLYGIKLFSDGKKEAVKKWTVLIVCMSLVASHIMIANVSYHKLQMAYEKSYGTLIRIANTIEQTENTDKCSKILVIGALENSEAYSCVLPPDMTGTTDGFIVRADDETVGQSVFCSAINDYCGKNYTFLAGKEKDALMKYEKVQKMDSWPHKNSVLVIGDVIVLKLGAEDR